MDRDRDRHTERDVEYRRDAGSTAARGRDARDDVGVAEARRRFGGIDFPATLVGMLVALALLFLLSGLVGAAIGAIGYQLGLQGNVQELSIGGLIAGLIVLFLSFLIGGWAAARIARYDGPKNGLLTAVWAIILAAVLAALGAWVGSQYNVFQNVNVPDVNVRLPQFFSGDALTMGAIISAIVSILVMLLGGWLGGLWGQRYHRRADATIAGTREGGIYREREVARSDYRDDRR